MARPKKSEERVRDTTAVLQVSVDDFVRTRDSVVTGLATLQSAVQDLSRAYIAHTNTVLGRSPGTTIDLLTISNPLGDNTLVAQRAASPLAKSDLPEIKKKKKRVHDPNAPKRPLTPFFLYMQTARPVIASDLGEQAKKGDVSTEGTRRWQAMSEDQKQLWKDAYAKNLAEYQERVTAYKQNLAKADPAAAQLVAENGALTEPGEDEEELEHPLDEHAGEEEDEEDEEEEEVAAHPPTPSPPRVSPEKPSKRRKTAKEPKTSQTSSSARQTSAVPATVKETAIHPPGNVVPAEKDRGAGKKRNRRSMATEEDTDSRTELARASPKVEKEKRSRRKRKSDIDE
ncbi:MAG: hypothetical protein M1837_003778 [Sclerophora amabilis]|nr:MAG: hypothetical protein M1837_003778 [Sclerophora amabilis]